MGSGVLSSGDAIYFNTADPKAMPLPHPAMFQLHAMVSRIMAKKAAAGYPVMSIAELKADMEIGRLEGGGCLAGELIHGGDATGHGLVPVPDGQVGKAEGREAQTALHLPSRLAVVSSPSSAASRPRYVEDQETGRRSAPDKPRLVDSVNAEYSSRMTEMYEKMTEILGRKVDGDMWWTKEGGS